MADNVEELVVRIGADIDELRRQMKAGEAVVGKASKKMEGAISKFRGGIDRAGKRVAKFAIGLGSAAAAFFSVKKIIDAMNRADGIAKTADRLGIAADRLIGLQHAAQLSGVSTSALNMALQRMGRRVSQAAKGSGEAEGAIRELGLEARSLAKLPLNEQLDRVADAMTNVKSQTDKVRLAQKLFDSEGVALINMLEGGSAALAQYQKEAEALGITMSRFDLAQIEQANDGFAKLGAVIEGTARRIGAQLAPMLNFLSEQFIAGAKNQEGLSKATENFSRFVVGAIAAVKKTWSGLLILWESGKLVIFTVGQEVAKAAKKIVQTVGGIEAAWDAFWGWLGAAADVAWEAVKVGFDTVVRSIAKGLTHVQEAFSDALIAIGKKTRESGVKGVADMGAKLESSAADLKVQAIRTRAALDEQGAAVADGLEQARTNLVAAEAKLSASFSAGLEKETPALDEFIALTSEAKDEAAEAIRKAAEFAVTEGNIGRAIEEFEAFRAVWNDETAARVAALEDRAAQELALEEELRQEKLTRQQEFNNQLHEQERDLMERNEFLWRSGWKGKLQVMQQFTGQISQLMESENRKQFEIGKAAAISEAVISTVLSAQKAYQAMVGIPIVGPALAVAAAGAAVAAGVQNVNRIRSTQFGGGGGGGGAGAGGGAALGGGAAGAGEAAQSPANQTNVDISLQGDSFSANQVRGLIGQINEQTEDNVNLQVSG